MTEVRDIVDINKLKQEFFIKEVPGYMKSQSRYNIEEDDYEEEIDRKDTFAED